MKQKAEQLFIYKLRLNIQFMTNSNWTGQVLESMEGHHQFLDDLGKDGILVFAGRTEYSIDDINLFGIAILKTESLEAVKEIVKNDPGIVNGILKAEIHPFSMGIRYLENISN